MSAIAGIAHLDGRPADAGALARMLHSVRHRGPDGNGVWSDGWVALGHAMLRTTPESVHERQPLGRAPGDLIITADARIDNRDELLRALGSTPPGDVPFGRASDVPDSAVSYFPNKGEKVKKTQ
jgi:asparagine synthase (glutamine-hydrolysing)